MTAALVVVCAPVAGLRVSFCCRRRWQPQCLSPLGHRCLGRALVSALFQSVPLLPRSEKEMLLAVFGTGLEIKFLAQDEFTTRLCPARRRSISLLHCPRIQPPDRAVRSMQA